MCITFGSFGFRESKSFGIIFHMRKEQFITGEIYHVLNRGVDKRILFLEDNDYLRFIHDMYEFNDENPASNMYYRDIYDSRNPKKEKEEIVDILAYALMPNHFHFLIRQKQDGGIKKFMHKLGAGYANYFNKKNARSGTLFQGRYKAIEIKGHSHLLHLPFYIHCNPLDLIAPEWRKRELKDLDKTVEFLKRYRWSSFPDYAGVNNFPLVINQQFLKDFFGGYDKVRSSLAEWLKNFDGDEYSGGIFLE